SSRAGRGGDRPRDAGRGPAAGAAAGDDAGGGGTPAGAVVVPAARRHAPPGRRDGHFESPLEDRAVFVGPSAFGQRTAAGTFLSPRFRRTPARRAGVIFS